MNRLKLWWHWLITTDFHRVNKWWVGFLTALLIMAGIVLGISYGPGPHCTQHILFIGNTVVEYCI